MGRPAWLVRQRRRAPPGALRRARRMRRRRRDGRATCGLQRERSARTLSHPGAPVRPRSVRLLQRHREGIAARRRPAGVAFADATSGPKRIPRGRRCGDSVMATFDHAGSEIVPAWPVALVARRSRSWWGANVGQRERLAAAVVAARRRGLDDPLGGADVDLRRLQAGWRTRCRVCGWRGRASRCGPTRSRSPRWCRPGFTVSFSSTGVVGHQLVPRRVVALAARAVGLGADLLERPARSCAVPRGPARRPSSAARPRRS